MLWCASSCCGVLCWLMLRCAVLADAAVCCAGSCCGASNRQNCTAQQVNLCWLVLKKSHELHSFASKHMLVSASRKSNQHGVASKACTVLCKQEAKAAWW